MPFIPFEDGAMAVIELGSDATAWTNTLWFKQLYPAAADYQELANYLHDWAEGVFPPAMWLNFYLRKVTVYDMQTSLGSVTVDERDPVIGAKAGTGSPISVAAVVTFRTLSRGRSARGRNYVTGFVEADTGADEVVTPALLTALAAGYTDLIDEVQLETDFYWVVASHYSLGAPRAEVLPLQISSAEVRSAKFGSQRRRVDRP